MNLAGDLDRYTQFEAAQSLEKAAANPGGAAGVGVGLGAGVAMGQTMMNAMQHPAGPVPPAPASGAPGPGAAKFCQVCGHQIPGAARFCPDCGKPQGFQE